MTEPFQNAVVLLSGGVDSATTAMVARRDGYAVYALTFDYGQRNRAEIEAARSLAAKMDVREHKLFKIDLGQIGGSALTDRIPVPKDRPLERATDEIPITYVPARNTIFLSIALGYAERVGAGVIYIGANAVDYSGYPDCRPEFLKAFERLANLATKAGVEGGTIQIKAPLVEKSKADILRFGTELGVDYSLTMSCYDPSPDSLACGHCDSCRLRQQGFRQAGIEDPTRYVSEAETKR